MSKSQTIEVNGALVTVHQQEHGDYISRTGIPNFNLLEFDHVGIPPVGRGEL
jgi:hypothetical protein